MSYTETAEITMTEGQLYSLIEKTLMDIVVHLQQEAPDRTLTARALINPAILEMEAVCHG